MKITAVSLKNTAPERIKTAQRVKEKQKPQLKYLTSDINKEGKLPLLISAKDAEQVKEIIKICKSFGQNINIKDDLSIIGGLSLEVSARKLQSFINLLPKDVKLILNKPEEYSLPEPVQNPKLIGNFFKLNNAVKSFGIDEVQKAGFTGKGVGIAIIDSGIYPHPDFEDRITLFKSFEEKDGEFPHDDFGHGTHVAGIAAGSGKISGGILKGAAPDADIIALKIGPTPSQVINALIWAVKNKDKYNIRVINMSLGTEAKFSYKNDLWARASELAWNAGIFVAVAAGNEGPVSKTISSPANDPEILTVANLDDRKTLTKKDDKIYISSSRGPTPFDGLPKPDVAAPGTNIISTLAPDSFLSTDIMNYPHLDWNQDNTDDYFVLTGTSMATPMVAGLAADLIQANPSISPRQLKQILMKTADLLPNYSNYAQGKGAIDPYEALTKVLELKNTEKQ